MNLKKTKIVATVGPASESPAMMERLLRAGADVVRFNFSHGSHDEHLRRLRTVREVAVKTGKHVGLLQDLGGPKIRLGDFVGGEIVLKRGQKFVLSVRKCAGTARKVFVNYKKLPQEVSVGQSILLDDGTKRLTVVKTDDDEIVTVVAVGGRIRSRRGVNVPGANLSVSSLTAKDRRDLKFGIAQGVDFVALSFVRSAADIVKLRRILRREGSEAMIVAKIETQEAIDNIDEIIAQADAVMVARGDLAVEVPAEDVPHLQKTIVAKCNIAGKPVIVATQMLESMISSPVPTRAEVTDVANAILDGTDAVMLSAETAMGEYPVEAVKVMCKVALRTEKDAVYRRLDTVTDESHLVSQAVTRGAIAVSHNVRAKVIVALTESGFTARQISRYKPAQPIVAMTPSERVARQLALSFGCLPQVIEGFSSVNDTLSVAADYVASARYAKKGERFAVVAGMPFGRSGTTNMVVIQTV